MKKIATKILKNLTLLLNTKALWVTRVHKKTQNPPQKVILGQFSASFEVNWFVSCNEDNYAIKEVKSQPVAQ